MSAQIERTCVSAFHATSERRLADAAWHVDGAEASQARACDAWNVALCGRGWARRTCGVRRRLHRADGTWRRDVRLALLDSHVRVVDALAEVWMCADGRTCRHEQRRRRPCDVGQANQRNCGLQQVAHHPILRVSGGGGGKDGRWQWQEACHCLTDGFIFHPSIHPCVRACGCVHASHSSTAKSSDPLRVCSVSAHGSSTCHPSIRPCGVRAWMRHPSTCTCPMHPSIPLSKDADILLACMSFMDADI